MWSVLLLSGSAFLSRHERGVMKMKTGMGGRIEKGRERES